MWSLANGIEGDGALTQKVLHKPKQNQPKPSGLDRDFTYGYIPLCVPKLDQLREGNWVHVGALAAFEDAQGSDSYGDVCGSSAMLSFLSLYPTRLTAPLRVSRGFISFRLSLLR